MEELKEKFEKLRKELLSSAIELASIRLNRVYRQFASPTRSTCPRSADAWAAYVVYRKNKI